MPRISNKIGDLVASEMASILEDEYFQKVVLKKNASKNKVIAPKKEKADLEAVAGYKAFERFAESFEEEDDILSEELSEKTYLNEEDFEKSELDELIKQIHESSVRNADDTIEENPNEDWTDIYNITAMMLSDGLTGNEYHEYGLDKPISGALADKIYSMLKKPENEKTSAKKKNKEEIIKNNKDKSDKSKKDEKKDNKRKDKDVVEKKKKDSNKVDKKSDKKDDKKDDKKKDKKEKGKKAKASAKCDCPEDCPCKDGGECKCNGECSDCAACGDQMYASAFKYIVETLIRTSEALDNMGLNKSAVATMVALDHIIEEAAKKNFSKEASDDLNNALDESDVRGMDLLLGLDDPEAREYPYEQDDPASAAVLEDLLTKYPDLVEPISQNLKKQFGQSGDTDVEKQLQDRVKARLDSIGDPSEDSEHYFSGVSDIFRESDELLKEEKIPEAGKLPLEERPTIVNTPTVVDIPSKESFVVNDKNVLKAFAELNEWLNADKVSKDHLIKLIIKELQMNQHEYDDGSGEIDHTHLAEQMADQHDLYEGDNQDIPEYVFDAAIEAVYKWKELNEEDEEDEED